MIKTIRSIVAVLVALHVTLTVTQAETLTWYGDGYWSDVVNSHWTPCCFPPDDDDIAEILGGVPKIVAGEEKVLELRVSPSPHSGTGVKVIDEGYGAGQLSTQRAYIGYATNSNGTADVTVDAYSPTGPATPVKWTNTGDLIVGYKNTQDVNTLNVLNAGKVTSGRGFIGDFPGVVGIATVDGSYIHGASIWDSGSELRVGNLGRGTLNVSNRARVYTSGDLIVGSQSTATNQMNISSEAVVTSNRGFLGDYGWFVDTANAVGQVTVTGTDSMWDIGNELRVGNAGNGTLTIQSGGTVTSSVGRIAMHPGSNGLATVTGSGSNWTMTGDLSVGSSGALNLNGGLVKAPLGVNVAASGNLNGSGSIIANSVINSGNVHPTNPSAALSVTGNYIQTSSGNFNLDLDFDGIGGKLSVNGNLTLAGKLQVTNLDFPFSEPEVGQSYDILDWTGSLFGQFDTITLPAVHGAKMWNKTKLYTTGVISVSKPGDFSGDGFVNAGDFIAWRKSGGSAGEYNLWRANFGTTFAASSGMATLGSSMGLSVPEPSSIALLVATTILMTCGRVSRPQFLKS